MFEILQWLFVTNRDQLVYSSKQRLIKEMLEDYEFDKEDVADVINWFEQISFSYKNLLVNKDITREVSEWEKRVLPSEFIDKILILEKRKEISSQEREILFDRIGELCLDYTLDSDEVNEIFDGLLIHIKNINVEAVVNVEQIQYYWSNNTVH